jgi:hypothetical protein
VPGDQIGGPAGGAATGRPDQRPLLIVVPYPEVGDLRDQPIDLVGMIQHLKEQLLRAAEGGQDVEVAP